MLIALMSIFNFRGKSGMIEKIKRFASMFISRSAVKWYAYSIAAICIAAAGYYGYLKTKSHWETPAPLQEEVQTTNNIPYRSFVLIQHEIAIVPTDCILSMQSGCEPPPGDIVRSRGSGAVIGHGQGMSHILTAAHVCQHRRAEGILLGGVPYTYRYVERVNIVDYYGNTRPGLVLGVDEENDLCLITVPGQWTDAVPLAGEMPEMGEEVQNMAAPMGIFSPGMVLMFDGRYSGTDNDGDSFFTIPSYAGSSGSAIVNEAGELVGVIHSATVNFYNIALASSVYEVEDFLAEYQSIFQ